MWRARTTEVHRPCAEQAPPAHDGATANSCNCVLCGDYVSDSREVLGKQCVSQKAKALASSSHSRAREHSHAIERAASTCAPAIK